MVSSFFSLCISPSVSVTIHMPQLHSELQSSANVNVNLINCASGRTPVPPPHQPTPYPYLTPSAAACHSKLVTNTTRFSSRFQAKLQSDPIRSETWSLIPIPITAISICAQIANFVENTLISAKSASQVQLQLFVLFAVGSTPVAVLRMRLAIVTRAAA